MVVLFTIDQELRFELEYRTRAINRRGFYSIIVIWGFRLSLKNNIKNSF